MIGLSLPPVIKNLIIINFLFYFAMVIGGGQFLTFNLYDFFALHHFTSDLFWPHQYITYQFLHSLNDFRHLLFNMFALWMFGGLIERSLGSKRFLIYYMATAIGAGIIYTITYTYDMYSMQSYFANTIQNIDYTTFLSFLKENDLINLVNKDFLYEWDKIGESESHKQQAIAFLTERSEIVLKNMTNSSMVGASGAVFGILLAFGMMFPNQEILLGFIFPIKAKYFVVGYGLIELYLGVANNPEDNVAHFAHLGGMIVGFILIKYWRSKGQLYS